MKLYLVAFILIGYLSNVDNVNSMFIESMHSFSIDLYKAISRNEPRNAILSPYSAFEALCMLQVGSQGNTKKELNQTLHLIDDDFKELNVETQCQIYHDELMNGVTSELIILNKPFISTDVYVKQEYKTVLNDFFNTSEQEVNFANRRQAASEINGWVSNQTNDKIKQILSANDVNSNTAMVLANVVYFKGEWQYKFRDFSNFYFNSASEQRSIVPAMRQVVNVLYGNVPELGASFVELPYKGNNNFSMTIILPDNGVSLEAVERRLETMTVPDVRKHRSLKTVVITMPQFKFERTIDLIPILEEMGVKDVFDIRHSNLERISGHLFSVDKMKQKVILDVNKEGSEVSAPTVAVSVYTSSNAICYSETISFIVNRPFHFKIMRTAGFNDGIILLSGNYKGPEYN